MKSIFIILNYNSYKLTEKLALKISKMESINNVVIVDNCSSDNSFAYLLKLKDSKIDVIKTQKNGGYSYGNNFGAKYSKKYNPDILFFSNPDVDIEEESIIKIIECFKKYNYSILSAIEYNIEDKISDVPIWRRMKYIDDLKDCYFLIRKLTNFKKQIQVHYDKEVQNVEIVKGSFLAIKYNDFEEVAGFDENVFLFCEERIISHKMLDNHKLIGIVTNAKYNHNHSTSINKKYRMKSKQIKLLYKSRLYYNKKYNKINFLKYFIMYVSMKISILEYYIYDYIKLLKNKKNNKK